MSILPFGMLLAVQQFYNAAMSQAIFLRANRQEPFVWIWILHGVLVAVSNYWLGRRFGVVGVASGYLVSTMLFALLGSCLTRYYWRNWQEEPASVS